MNTRHDIHRPSAINPADYQFVAYDYIGPNAADLGFLSHEKATFRAHMARTGGKFSGHDHGGTCHICGATAFYVAKFYHPKTNTYIVSGEDCADKMHLGDPRAFRTFRDKVRAGIVATSGKRKAEKIMTEAGLSEAWALYTGETRKVKYEENTIFDICSKLVRYGSITPGQVGLIRKLLIQIKDRAAKEAARAAEAAAALPVPVTDKRIKIEGLVLSLREPDEGARFPAWKMLVQVKEGWKIWGTVPAALSGIQKGDRVSFMARVTKSAEDEKFGFFSRPSNAEVLAKREDTCPS